MRRCLLLFPVLLALPVTGAPAELTVPLTVTETLGERRFGYPVTARVPIPRGTRADAAHALLESGGKPLRGAQFDPGPRRADGSARWVDVSFNLSPGPLESQRLLLRVGPEVHGETPAPGVVEETDAAFTIRGTYRVPRTGPAFLDSVRYGAERLRKPAFWRVEGADGPLPMAAGGTSRILSPGPVNAVVERSGAYEGGDAKLPYRLTLQQPNSKSWIDAAFSIDDPRGLVRRVSVTMPYALQKGPARWDVGVGSWLYGTLRPGAEALLQARRGAWTLFSPAPSVEYAAGTPGRARFEGWGHLIDGAPGGLAVAFGSPDYARDKDPLPGEVRLTPDGDVTLAWTVAGKGRHAVRALFHHVADPVPVTAVTSPAAMLHPLRVTLPRE